MLQPNNSGKAKSSGLGIFISSPTNRERVDYILSGIGCIRDDLDELNSLVVTLQFALTSGDLPKECQDIARLTGVLVERIDQLDDSAKGIHNNLIALLEVEDEEE